MPDSLAMVEANHGEVAVEGDSFLKRLLDNLWSGEGLVVHGVVDLSAECSSGEACEGPH